MLSAAWIYFTTDIVRNRKNTHTWTVVIVGGARGRGKPRAFVLAPGCSPTGKILVAIKCPLVTIDMLRCDLLNIIFAKQHIYSWFFLHFQLLKDKQICASIERPNARNVSASPPDHGMCLWTLLYVFSMHTTAEYGRHLVCTHKKDYCPCSLDLAPCCSQL